MTAPDRRSTDRHTLVMGGGFAAISLAKFRFADLKTS